jgi:hypothetical protein
MKLRIEGETKVEAKVHFKDNSLVIASLCALIDIHINFYYLFILKKSHHVTTSKQTTLLWFRTMGK